MKQLIDVRVLVPTLFAVMLGCGTAPAPASPEEVARDALRGLDTADEAWLCGADVEPSIRRLAPSIPPCWGDWVQIHYLVARTLGSTIVVVDWLDRRAEETGGVRSMGALLFVDGRPTSELPTARTASLPDERALLLGALRFAYPGSRLAPDHDAARYVDRPLGPYARQVEVGHLGLDGGASLTAVCTEELAPRRRAYSVVRATLAADGAVTTAQEPFASMDGNSVHLPALGALVAETFAGADVGPARICGSPQEPTLRRLFPDLPPCGGALRDAFDFAVTRAGPTLIATWTEPHPASFSSGFRHRRRFFGDRLSLDALVDPPLEGPREDDDPLDALRLAVFANALSPFVATDVVGARALLGPDATRAQLRGIGLGHSDDGTPRLRAISVRTEVSHRSAPWVAEAWLDPEGALHVASHPLASDD